MATHTMEQFTQRARRALSFSQEEAERQRHNSIDTEHLLLGLMREEAGVAGRVLRELGLDQRRIEELVERLTRSRKREPNTRLDLSSGMKNTLEYAVEEARNWGHTYIGTEHLLLGLVREDEGAAMDILKRFSVSPEEVREHVRRILRARPAEPRIPLTRVTSPTIQDLNETTLRPAIREASNRGQRFAGTLHLLIVMLQHEGPAQITLREMGLDEQSLEAILGKSTTSTDDLSSNFAYSVNSAFTHASSLAISMKDSMVRDEHLLLALADRHADIFELLHIDPERLRSELEKRLNAE